MTTSMNRTLYQIVYTVTSQCYITMNCKGFVVLNDTFQVLNVNTHRQYTYISQSLKQTMIYPFLFGKARTFVQYQSTGGVFCTNMNGEDLYEVCFNETTWRGGI